jgi:hypothetical protein
MWCSFYGKAAAWGHYTYKKAMYIILGASMNNIISVKDFLLNIETQAKREENFYGKMLQFIRDVHDYDPGTEEQFRLPVWLEELTGNSKH